MKPTLLALTAIAALGLLAYRWLTAAPSTALVDAKGSALTAGTVPGGAEPDAGTDPFAEARGWIEQGAFARAKERLLELLVEEDRDGEACLLLSRATRELRQLDEAVDYGLKASELLPDHAPAHLAYARALGEQLMRGTKSAGDILRAMPRVVRFRAALDRVVELDPSDVEARTMMVFVNLAPVIGDAEQAIAVAREIEARDPVLGRKMLAYALDADDKTDEAIEVCEAVLAEDPDAQEFSLIVAGLYAEQGRVDEAVTAYRAARRGPRGEDYYLATHRLANLLLAERGAAQEALTLFDEFLAARPSGSFVPGASEVEWGRGRALEALGRADEARAAYRTSLELDPAFEPAAAALEALGS